MRLSREFSTNRISPRRGSSSTRGITHMAAAAAAAYCPAPPRRLCSAMALLPAPSSHAASCRRRADGYGYGSSSARRWPCRRWAHRPESAAPRIRRQSPSRRGAAVRVSCAYSPGGKGLAY